MGSNYLYLAIAFPRLLSGPYDRARQELKHFLARVHEVNSIGIEASVYYDIGYLALVEKAYNRAHRAFEESINLFQAVQGDAYTGLDLTGLIFSTCFMGQLERSQQYIAEFLKDALRKQDFLYLLVGLPGVALYLLCMGEAKKAIAIWAWAKSQPFVANSQWYADVVGKPIEAIVATLCPDEVAAVLDRGKDLDW